MHKLVDRGFKKISTRLDSGKDGHLGRALIEGCALIFIHFQCYCSYAVAASTHCPLFLFVYEVGASIQFK